MKKIFVQIASYRDSQLMPTITDCIANARFPEALVFCIAWQRAADESFGAFSSDPRFIVIDIPYSESRGACWARNLIQKRYNGEAYTLAIDSHHRFVPDWDVQCIEMIQELQSQGYPKPILTTYAPSFLPEQEPNGREGYATFIQFSGFSKNGVVQCRPGRLLGQLERPVRARFLSAHMIFTLGEFCLEVPHDPNYYFHGEEINLAARAYTHGYDLFHPHKIICWHEYVRNHSPKHWSDDANWHLLEKKSNLRNRRFFGMEEASGEDFSGFDFGVKRCLRDYEKFAGLNFKNRSAQQYTIDHGEPPNPEMFSEVLDWERSFSIRIQHNIELDTSSFSDVDYQFWSLIYQDSYGMEIFRYDVSADLPAIQAQCETSGQKIMLEMSFDAFHGREPKKWIVWPYSKSKGWCTKVCGLVDLSAPMPLPNRYKINSDEKR